MNGARARWSDPRGRPRRECVPVRSPGRTATRTVRSCLGTHQRPPRDRWAGPVPHSAGRHRPGRPCWRRPALAGRSRSTAASTYSASSSGPDPALGRGPRRPGRPTGWPGAGRRSRSPPRREARTARSGPRQGPVWLPANCCPNGQRRHRRSPNRRSRRRSHAREKGSNSKTVPTATVYRSYTNCAAASADRTAGHTRIC